MTLLRRTLLKATLALGFTAPAWARSPAADALISAARSQIGVTNTYDGAYQRLDYPGGDVDRATGVCIDVVIRAYRDAFDVDFQKLIHEDMRADFGAYPGIWGLRAPDRNIDHRRVPNLETYLARQDREKPARDWQPGDLVTLRLPRNLPHVAIVSDQKDEAGEPLVIHNIGRGVREESLLGLYAGERRFRYLPTLN